MIAIRIHAHVTDLERPMVEAASGFMVEAFGPVAGGPAAVEVTFASDLEALRGSPAGAIRLVSLVPELARLDEAWPAEHMRLRSALEGLAAGGEPLFLCTVLRHAGSSADAALLYRRRVRIRRLNLLAAEMSHRLGTFVVDVDRVIATIGGRHLGTDFRLGSPDAASVAGHALALCITGNALDAVMSFEAQDEARDTILRNAPAPPVAKDMVPSNVLSFGRGRRKQAASTVIDTERHNQVGRLLRQTLKRDLPAGEALQKFVQAVRRRGALESGSLLASAVLRIIKGSWS